MHKVTRYFGKGGALQEALQSVDADVIQVFWLDGLGGLMGAW